MNPTQSSIYEYFSPWLAEKSIAKCTDDITNGLRYDSRYIDTGIDIDLQSMYQDNGIALLLQGRYYNYDDFTEKSKRKEINLSLFSRPTLSWDLQCDADVETSKTTFYHEIA